MPLRALLQRQLQPTLPGSAAYQLLLRCAAPGNPVLTLLAKAPLQGGPGRPALTAAGLRFPFILPIKDGLSRANTGEMRSDPHIKYG